MFLNRLTTCISVMRLRRIILKPLIGVTLIRLNPPVLLHALKVMKCTRNVSDDLACWNVYPNYRARYWAVGARAKGILMLLAMVIYFYNWSPIMRKSLSGKDSLTTL